MKGIIQYIVLLIIFLTSNGMSGQEFGSNAINAPLEQQTSGGMITGNDEKQGFKPDVSVTLGSTFSSWAPGFNTFGTWVMPEFTLPVSKKFAFRAGIGYSSMFYSSPGAERSLFTGNNAQFGHVYVSGLYRVNEKFTVTGTAYKSFMIQPPQNEVNPRALDLSNEGVMLNLDYRINDHMRINAAFSYQKYNPYGGFFEPGGFYGQPSPFFNPAFGTGF